MTTATRVIQFGPMIGLSWPDNTRLWVQRVDVEYLRLHLLPARSPRADLPGSCWVWTGPVASDGRPVMQVAGNTTSVRRMLYDIEFGPLSVRDYLSTACGVGRCVNPHHTLAEGRGPVRGKAPPRDTSGYDRCKHGHALTPDNSYLYQGRKMCRVCRAEAERRYRERSVVRAGRERRAPARGRRSGLG